MAPGKSGGPALINHPRPHEWIDQATAGDNGAIRVRAEVTGVVQGVGFRPYVYHLAQKHGLGGFVRNTAQGALLEIEGPSVRVGDFLSDLPESAPPLARIIGIDTRMVDLSGGQDFAIETSGDREAVTALISPDVAVCDDCLREMRSESDRRLRYPFINCTNCGPRFTIVQDLPYDRDKTSMAAFDLCPACSQEYHDPADRRFHAQPNACPDCGPQVSLLDAGGYRVAVSEPIAEAAMLLASGKCLAVKGLGGYHLAVDARHFGAVRRLRIKKSREEKPLAVMVPDLDRARRLADIDAEEERVLASPARPIVLVRKKEPFSLAANVAPDNKYIGVMLPYTPLHHMLLESFDALVMTSANLSEEPICKDDDDALVRLDGLVDYFLVHNRPIHVRADDSVVRLGPTGVSQVRRSRGFVPGPVFLKNPQPQTLAVGAGLKNTICLTKDDRAFLSQHIGDLENLLALEFFEETISHLKKVLDVQPRVLAHDRHPGYLSSKWAAVPKGYETIGVQHHHAHVAAVMAEHHLDGPVVGLACDGTGYGDGGQIWGGEILIADLLGYRRAAHFQALPLPGGDAAAKEPWRMAISALDQTFGPRFLDLDLDLVARHGEDQVRRLLEVIRRPALSPETTSLGRLFDAAAALAGIKDRSAYEGQAAMMLEMRCPNALPAQGYPFDLSENGDGTLIIGSAAMFEALVRDLDRGADESAISGRFHAGVVGALVETAHRVARDNGLDRIVLSGGCFLNQVLLAEVSDRLTRLGRQVFAPSQVPAGDGGLSLGQAAIAGAMAAR